MKRKEKAIVSGLTVLPNEVFNFGADLFQGAGCRHLGCPFGITLRRFINEVELAAGKALRAVQRLR